MTWTFPLAVTHDDYIVDATGGIIPLEEIAAALNAAPKRAFETLTVAALSQMLDSIVEEFGEWPSEGSTDDQIAWRAKADAAFLSRLQAFAAPAWQPITVEAVNGKGFLLLMPTKTIAACKYPTVAQLIPSERSLGKFEWEEEGGTTYSFRCFSHFMPLPAAPEAQGGTP